MLSGSPGPEGDGSRASLLMAPIPFNRTLRDLGCWQTSFFKTFYFEIILEPPILYALHSLYPNDNCASF